MGYLIIIFDVTLQRGYHIVWRNATVAKDC